MKSDIAVLTDVKELMVFEIVGAEIFYVQKNDARQQLLEAAKSYKFIIVTETLAKLLEMEIKEFESKLFPTIVYLPSTKGESGFALKSLAKKARTSLGIEI